MRRAERLELEQHVLEVTKDYPTTLDDIKLKLHDEKFKDVFQAILHLMKSGNICYHNVRGKTAYRRTKKGFDRRWNYYE